MPRLIPLTPQTAVGASRELLGDLVERHGRVGDMVATMAHSPAVLGGYLGLSRAMRRSKLDRRTSELISIAIQERQGCGLCLRAHIDVARGLGVPDDEVERARQGTSVDPAVAALVELALRLYVSPSTVTDEHVAALRAFGHGDRVIADVVGVVALNVLTGAFNLLAGLGAAAASGLPVPTMDGGSFAS